MNIVRGDVFAGLLVKADSVEVAFAEVRGRFPEDGFSALCPAGWPIDDAWPILDGSAEAALRSAVAYIAANCPRCRAIGCGSYGPLMSVSLEDREASFLGRGALYGVVNGNSSHVKLRELRVYHEIKEMAGYLGLRIPIRVHTDVVCGALAEAWGRTVRGEGDTHRQLGANDGLVFINLSEGVGGAYVRGIPIVENGLNPELGYTTPQLLAGDPLLPNWRRLDESHPIYVEDLLSVSALLRRANALGGRHGREEVVRICDIPSSSPSWDYVAHYIAQLVAMVMMIVVPQQVVLHGSVIEEVHSDVDLLRRVRDAFPRWIGEPDKLVLNYPEMRNRETFIDFALRANPMLDGAVLLGALECVAAPSRT